MSLGRFHWLHAVARSVATAFVAGGLLTGCQRGGQQADYDYYTPSHQSGIVIHDSLNPPPPRTSEPAPVPANPTEAAPPPGTAPVVPKPGGLVVPAPTTNAGTQRRDVAGSTFWKSLQSRFAGKSESTTGTPTSVSQPRPEPRNAPVKTVPAPAAKPKISREDRIASQTTVRQTPLQPVRLSAPVEIYEFDDEADAPASRSERTPVSPKTTAQGDGASVSNGPAAARTLPLTYGTTDFDGKPLAPRTTTSTESSPVRRGSPAPADGSVDETAKLPTLISPPDLQRLPIDMSTTSRESTGERPTRTVSLSTVQQKGLEFVVRDFALCREVRGLRAYTPVDKRRLVMGQDVLLYAAVEGVTSVADGGGFLTVLDMTADLLDAHGRVRATFPLSRAADREAVSSNEVFVCASVRLPADLPVGNYTLRVVLNDQIARQTATHELPIAITQP